MVHSFMSWVVWLMAAFDANPLLPTWSPWRIFRVLARHIGLHVDRTDTCSPFVEGRCSCTCLVAQDHEAFSPDVGRHLWRGGGCTRAKQLLSSARLSVAKSDWLLGAADFQLDRGPCGQMQRIWQGNQLTLVLDRKRTEYITQCHCEVASSCWALSSEASIFVLKLGQ